MLSDISSIVNAIEVKDDFSFVDVLASFVGNREFYQTYEQFRDGQVDDPTAQVWVALSAIGNEVGKKIHTNIRDYIDLVSNVDRCKVKNLQSMLNIYGQRYNLFDNVERYPLEVQQLLDIFSLNKRYILKNDFLNEDLRNDLSAEGVLSSIDCDTNYSYAKTVIDQEKYELYVKDIFQTLLSGFLDLEYNDCERTKVRETLTIDDIRGYSLSSYSETSGMEQFKIDNNIPSSFDEKAIVDAIEDGTDTFENYSGAFLELLQKEVARRVSPLVYHKRSQNNKKISNTDYESIEKKTRYSYYRKAKVLEYFHFIGNFFSEVNDLSNTVKYDYDSSYFMMTETNEKDALVYNSQEQVYEICEDVVERAAEQLKNISMYIATLRERLKLQTRKNYMKGTANLLIYLVNQYMVDYAKSQTTLFNQLANTSLSTLRERLIAHNPLQVHVVEYFDETEYFNIKTDTDNKSLNGNSTNLRYWQGEDSQSTGEFLSDDINKFYMRDLRLSADSSISNLVDFLDVIYNLGANTSYIDKSTGAFSTKMESNPDVYSVTIQRELSALQEHWDKFNQYIISDFPYSYPNDHISNQISNVIYDYISGYLSAQNLSAVSSIYDKYVGRVNEISADIQKLSAQYDNFVSNEYSFYYKGSLVTKDNILDKLTTLQTYSTPTNIVFSSLISTINDLSTNLMTLSTNYQSQILISAQPCGYVDSSYPTLHESLDDCEKFVNYQIDSRIDLLVRNSSQTDISADPIVQKLNVIKEKITKLRLVYTPHYNKYSNLAIDKDTSLYLANFKFKPTEYSFEELNKIREYINDTDKANYQKIVGTIDEMFNTYTKIKTDSNNLETDVSKDVMYYDTTGTTVETRIKNIKLELQDDIVDKTDRGISFITSAMNDVTQHMEYIAEEISAYMDSTEPLSNVVADRIETLNVRNTDEYLNQQTYFQMYNGLCSDSDIYYNYKNITHPSKQYHPYLWNFVNSDEYSSLFQNIFNLNNTEELNEDKIQSYISSYIGNFGQMINLWSNDGLDYTGYSSRYESSKHLTGKRRSIVQKVVDYDGIFFPDAVEYLRKVDAKGRNIGIQNCISSIQYGIDLADGKTSSPYSSLSGFYVEYYQPMELSKEELIKEQHRIEKFGSVISSITDPVSENEIFDIYKYGLDEFDNSYCLLKQYKDDKQHFYDIKDLTFTIKKNTPGKLWVRKASYPFAFPAFSTKDGNLSSSDGMLCVDFTFLCSLIGNELKSGSTYLTGNMYNFEFSNDRNSLALIMENNTLSGLKKYDTAEVLVTHINKNIGNEQDYDLVIKDKDVFKKERVGTLMGDTDHAAAFQVLSSKNITDVYTQTLLEVAKSDMSVIFSSSYIVDNITADSGSLSSIRDWTVQNTIKHPDLSSIISAQPSSTYYENTVDGYWYTLVDCEPNGNNNFYAVYAKKHLKSGYSSDSQLSTTITLEPESNFRVVNYNSQTVADAGGVQFPRRPSNDSVAFSMCDTTTIAIGVVIDSLLSVDSSKINAYTTNKYGLSAGNSNGYAKDDPIHDEMNSHDVFDSDIYVTNYSIRYKTLYPISNKVFNTNSDMSYLPAYPSNLVDIPKLPDISKNEYHSVELLGQSKNIDNLIDMINPTPNPYFSYSDISSNVFGRVYEDYALSCEKTLKILGNPAIHNNLKYSSEVSCDNSSFIWTIDLKNQFEGVNYKESDFETLRLLMFNRNNFGKNPYIICDISSILNKYRDVSYTQENANGFEVSIISGLIDATGTYDNEHVNSLESNRINNISNISIGFISNGVLSATNSERKLRIKFNLADTSKIDNTFIDKDKICLCLMNDRDLTMFKYYHYLDAYGLYISAETFDYSMYEDKVGDGYSITYDKEFINSKLSAGLWNFYYDKYGRKQYLRDINLEDYNYLSDIEVLRGYKKAIFKYDEELHFDSTDENFYYPTINLKYPHTFGSYAKQNAVDMDYAEGINLTNIFQSNELFIIDPTNAKSIFNNVGSIRIDISTDNSDCVMVDEGFLSGGAQYSLDDARMFNYLMLTETNKTSVDVTNESVDDVANGELSNVSRMGLENGSTTETKIINVSTASTDVQKLLRLYVNYKKDPDNNNGLVLYFNYFNYLNTPFIKIEDSRIYTEIIEGTYLKLAPGESGKLDIVVQFKYYDNGEIRGVKNIKMLTYQIFNVSDDKPKFLMREVYRIEKDSDIANQSYDFNIWGSDLKLNLGTSSSKKTSFKYPISWNVTTPVSNIQFNVLYDGTLFEIEGSPENITQFGPSYIQVNIPNPSSSYVELPFKCKLADNKMSSKLNNPSQIEIDEVKVIPTNSTYHIAVKNIVNGSIGINS